MSSQVSHDAFRTIFPKYAELLSEGALPGNESIQTFLRQELPRKVQLVRNMESSFNAFLTHFTNAILKRPQHSHLIHSLILKASDKIEKYFHHLSLITHKIDQQELKERLPRLDLQYLKRQFRTKLQNTQNLLRDKYFGGVYIERQCQQQIGMRLYVLFQLYHFLKGDPVTIAGKFKLRQQDVLWTVSKNQQPNDIADLINLDSTFLPNLQETVQKRCRPFTNKRDLLESKVRQILREGESKVGPNMNLLLQSLISKQRMRISRELSNSLGREFRQISEVEGQKQAKEMIAQVEVIKRQFAQLKNTTYFLDIMRGSFSEKYKMEVNRLQNVFYLTNLQKFLQDVSTFLEKVLSLEERLIQNRRQYMRDFGNAVEIKISDLIDSYGSKSHSTALTQIISNQFQLLESALYGVVSKPAPIKTQYNSYQKDDREGQRKKQMEMKAQQERQKRQAEKIKADERRRKDQQRLQQAREEREEKQRRRRQEAQKLQQEKKAQLQRKRQQKTRKDQQLRKQRQIEQMKKDQLQRGKKQELSKKRQEEEEKKKRERQEELRKRDQEKKKLLQKEQQQKRKRQADLNQRRKIEEQEKLKRQKERKLQEQKIKREKQQRQAEQKKKQQERLRLEKEKRQMELKSVEQRKKQQQRLKRQKQQRQKQQKEAQQRKKQQERLRLEKQKKQRQTKQAQERDRRERERKEKQAEQKKKEQQRLRIQKQKKQKKAEEQRIARQKQQKARKQQDDKLRQDKEKKERQEKERKQRQQKERRQKEQKQKKEKLEREKKQKEEKQRKEKQQKQRKEKIQKERKQKQQKQKKERQQKQKKEKEERQRKQRQEKQKKEKLQKQKRQRQEKEKRQRQQKQKLQKQRIQKQKKLKQQKQAQEKRKREQQQRQKKQQQLAKNKKPQPKKSSGINYGEFDDDDFVDDDLQDIKNAGKSKPPGNPNVDDEYVDDFDEQSPEKAGQIETKQLIGPNDIKCLNDYMKGTTYARKNKVNAQLLNKSSLYLMVFEQHVQNRKLFIFQSAISKAILDLGEELIDPNTNEQDLRMSVDTIREQMLKVYDQMFPGQEMHLNTRYIFPISFKNPFNLRVIELIPAHAYFQIIFEQQLPDDQQTQSSFQGAIEALLHIFQIEGEPRVQDMVVGQESKLVLQTFDKQLPCLLILFSRHYEQSLAKQILINQYTIQRFFYTTHPIEHLYQAMKEGQQIDQFYGKLMEKYVANDKIKICSVQVSSSDQQYSEKLTHSALGIKQEFKKSRHQSFLACFSIELQDENGEVQDKVAVYFSIDRASPKPAINYFLVSKDAQEQDNATLIFQLISEGDQDFEVNVFTDFTRHNCLSSYTDWTLPLWAHSTIKRKLSTLQAMRALAFAMTPYYLAFKQMD